MFGKHNSRRQSQQHARGHRPLISRAELSRMIGWVSFVLAASIRVDRSYGTKKMETDDRLFRRRAFGGFASTAIMCTKSKGLFVYLDDVHKCCKLGLNTPRQR